MIGLKYPFRLLFIKELIENKLKDFNGLSLVYNYQHLIKWHEHFIKLLNFKFYF
jgi:hypothetical protein